MTHASSSGVYIHKPEQKVLTMSNLSILERNILASIETEEGQKLFLRGKDKDISKAERCAWGWDEVSRVISKVRQYLEDTYGIKAVSEVMEFMKERQFHRHFPQGKKACELGTQKRFLSEYDYSQIVDILEEAGFLKEPKDV